MDEDLFALNVFSVVNLTRVVLPHMLQRWECVWCLLSSNNVSMCSKKWIFLILPPIATVSFSHAGAPFASFSSFYFRGSGCIALMSSSAGKAGVPFSGTYTGSKHGMPVLHGTMVLRLKTQQQLVNHCSKHDSTWTPLTYFLIMFSVAWILWVSPDGEDGHWHLSLYALPWTHVFKVTKLFAFPRMKPNSMCTFLLIWCFFFQFARGGRHRNPRSKFWWINESHWQKDDCWEVV